MASSNSIRFWSPAPPLTLNPPVPSPALETPGSNWIVFKRSDSPNKTGVCLIVWFDKILRLIIGFLMSISSAFWVTITSSRLSMFSSK